MNLYSAKSFYTMVFTSVIISIIISLVGFQKPFTVCIIIKKIPTFPFWNSSPLFFRVIFSSFLFLLINNSVPHILLYTF